MKKEWDSSESVAIHTDADAIQCARYLQLSGKVQGVGFRPYVMRLARKYKLDGWVRNTSGIVEVMLQGKAPHIVDFINHLIEQAPAIAEPVLVTNKSIQPQALNSFSILPSKSRVDEITTTKQQAHVTVPTDIHLCNECLDEMNDPHNRRYRYPFINCTQCGPRYTLIKQLPYDRVNTTMSGFHLCQQCQDEYDDIDDRRFHAEPVACVNCGPQLSFSFNNRSNNFRNKSEINSSDIIIGNDEAIAACVSALKQGKIIAVKGIGGYHLMCDACNEDAIEKLRDRKNRQFKPLALMFPVKPDNGTLIAEKYLQLSNSDKEFLLQQSRPILLVKPAKNMLSEKIAPGLNEAGVMFAYSPLHHLLINEFFSPLVATSANISGEPVLTDNHEVETRLEAIADGYLHHNRPIEHAADDSVFKTIYGKPRPLRVARGVAPVEFKLPFELPQPVLAVGAQMKNTFTLAWSDRAVMSPHMGDMHSPASFALFEKTLNDFQQLYNIEINVMIRDAHPGYALSRWVQQQELMVHSVYHHHAHAASAWYECNTHDDIICFCWDGLGYGEDTTLWGGEAFIGKPANWKRVASLRSFHLAGGDQVAYQPWRSAAALCWEAGLEYPDIPLTDPLIKQAWHKKINTQQTSSMGRLFDAMAALSGVSESSSYDAEAPMRLEALCNSVENAISLPMYMDKEILRADWQPLIQVMQDNKLSQQQRSNLFHGTILELMVQQAISIRQQHNINKLSFSGGVFQNRILTESAISRLQDEGFDVCMAEKIPLNDAGISIGQVIEYGFSLAKN